MADQIPTVGRQVHYVSHGSPNGQYPKTCRAATVTEVDAKDTDVVGLAVLNPSGLFFHSLADGGCVQIPAPADGNPDAYHGGTWHWPERV